MGWGGTGRAIPIPTRRRASEMSRGIRATSDSEREEREEAVAEFVRLGGILTARACFGDVERDRIG